MSFAKNIAIIGAMDCEIENIQKQITSKKVQKFNNFEITKGKLGKNKVILSISGVGKVNSAITTQFIIDKYKPDYIINTGIAGSLDKNFKKGDIVVAEKMIQHDFDLTDFGGAKGYMDTGINPDEPTVFNSDKDLMDLFLKNFDAKKGTILTGDTFIGNKNYKQKLNKQFKAHAIDMESAAIAQTAQLNNIPIIVIRTISDSSDVEEYKKNKLIYAKKSAQIIIDFIEAK